MHHQTIHRRPSQPARLVLGVATAGLALALTGCTGGGNVDPSASASASTTASATGSPAASTPTANTTEQPTASATDSPRDGGPADGADLPAVPLEAGPYEGEPRPLDEVFHLSCVEALAGEAELPETEERTDPEDKQAWFMYQDTAFTEGWKVCPTEVYGDIKIPAAFSVQAEAGENGLNRIAISDDAGERIGGVQRGVSGAAPDSAEVVEVVEITETAEHLARDGETGYLRSLVVETESGTQLMVDLVSAPAGTDPESLEVWDLAVLGGAQRDVVYASIPLDSADDADEAAGSDLHAVLRDMVGSYTHTVQ